MAVLIYSEIQTLYLQALQANVSTDLPVTIDAASEAMSDINEAYATIWDLAGGRVKTATSTAAWNPSQSSGTGGVATGILTDINEVLRVWSKSADTVGAAGDNELARRELSEIQYYRSRGTVLGSYAAPKLFSISAIPSADVTTANVNLVRLDYWPGVTALYFPIEYVPQFVPITGTTQRPDVNDVESRDIALIAARYRAPLIGRAELAVDIAARVSQRTQQLLERKLSAGHEGKQD